MAEDKDYISTIGKFNGECHNTIRDGKDEINRAILHHIMNENIGTTHYCP